MNPIVKVVVKLAVVALVSGCRPQPPPTSVSEPPPTDPPGRVPERAPEAASAPTEIRSVGIGDIRIAAPLPSPLPTAKSYALRLYADAQPLEGFWIGEPPVFAALADGPYHRWLNESGELDVPPPERFAAEALRDAEGGAVVEMVYVETPGVTTPEGVGVGTRYEDFMGAYPDAQVSPIPPLFEDPTCLAQTGAAPRVHFFFDRCEAGTAPPPDARIVRIAVR